MFTVSEDSSVSEQLQNDTVDDPPSVRLLLDRAAAIEATDVAETRSILRQARVLARASNDQPAEAEAIYRLALRAFKDANTDEAFAVALEAKELARRCGATLIEVWAIDLIGSVHFNVGSYPVALADSLQALDLYRQAGLRGDEGRLLAAIAAVHHKLGDLNRSVVTYEAALAANKGLDLSAQDALTLLSMAKVRFQRREYLIAAGLIENALTLATEHSPETVAGIEAQLVDAYVMLSDLQRAEQHLRLAYEAAVRHDCPPSTVVEIQLAESRWRVARREPVQAIDSYEQALTSASDSGLLEIVRTCLTELAGVHKSQGQLEQALVIHERLSAVNTQLIQRSVDQRVRTSQIAHDVESARYQAEILRLRTSELDTLARVRTGDWEMYQFEVFQRIASLAESSGPEGAANGSHVGDLAAAIALELGEPGEWCQQLRLAGQLHDIGNVCVPQVLLQKPGPLTDTEFELIKAHTTGGANLLKGSSSPTVLLAIDVALSHHERWDGEGYPNGLSKVHIPFAARIVSIADVFDALISVRVYKPAWAPVDAARYIIDAAGSQFEPRLVDAFVSVITRSDPALARQLGR